MRRIIQVNGTEFCSEKGNKSQHFFLTRKLIITIFDDFTVFIISHIGSFVFIIPN